MRRLVQHAAVGVACTALAVTAAVAGLGSPAATGAAVAGLGSPAATGAAVAVPAPVSTSAPAGGDPSVSASVAAERAARQAALDRSTTRDQLVRTAVEQALQREAALTAQSRSIDVEQAEIIADKKAAAAAAKARKEKARAEAVAEAEARAEAAREEAAREKAAAARAKAEAEAAAAAEQARSERVRAQGYEPGTTDPREMARQILQNRFGYGAEEFGCFDDVIIRESGWRVDATNPSSGAYGIPQALPGSKMASAGSDWRTNPATQIIWAVGYMDDRYGSPCAAWSFKSANDWY
ncbi:hypothetical protein GCM10009616_05270 [Microlunatus lacustris]